MVPLLIVSDDQAFALIGLHEEVGFYVHTGTKHELILAHRLRELINNKPYLQLFELPSRNIISPHQTLFAFVRYPRLLLYCKQSTEMDLTGFQHIDAWIKKQI